MRVRLVLVLASAVVAASGAVASAASAPALPVTVTHENGGVQVRSGVPGQPLVSVSADNAGVCVGFSLQMGTCLPVSTG